MKSPKDPKSLVPKDDSGSDTAARFHYQAEVMFPYCLECALGQTIDYLVAEHLEDIGICQKDGWRFIQVKSRNPELPLWTLATLLKDGGALRALFRTYQQLDGTAASLEILLEGAYSGKDTIRHLLRNGDRKNPQLLAAVQKALKLAETDAKNFLSQVTLLAAPPARPNIRSTNIHLIQHHNPGLDYTTAVDIYDKALVVIERAIRAETFGVEWPQYALNPKASPAEYTTRLQAKTLEKAVLHELFKSLRLPTTYLLKRITSDEGGVSELHRKLLIGGADPDLVDNARLLRANTQQHLFSLKAQGKLLVDELLDDLHIRLSTYIRNQRSIHKSANTPAPLIWQGLIQQFTSSAGVVDKNNVMDHDPMLLLGEVCNLAQGCKEDFGVARES